MDAKKKQLIKEIKKIHEFAAMLDSMDDSKSPRVIKENGKYRNTTITTSKR